MSYFGEYQSMEPGNKSAPGKPLRSIPDRVADYRLMDHIGHCTRVLDIGCNRGYFGVFLSTFIRRYHGIDVDAEDIAIGRAEVKARGLKNVHLFEGDFNPERFLGHKFDAVFSFAVHCYMNMDMETYALKLHSLLNPDGMLFLEGHPKGYEGEPERCLNPLLDALSKWFGVVDSWEVEDRELIRGFYLFRKKANVLSDNRGMAAKVYHLPGFVVEKHYRSFTEYPERNLKEHFDNECAALNVLSNQEHFPRVFHRVGTTFYLSYCGEIINRENRPLDWQVQCQCVIDTLNSHGLFHNDFKKQNVLVRSGIIYVVDFGFTSRKREHPNSNDLFAVVGNLRVPDRKLPKLREIGSVAASTFSTLCNSYELAARCSENNVPGVFVECGVYRGSQLAAMKLADPGRMVHAFDSFEGVPLAGPQDSQQPGVGAITHDVNLPVEQRLRNGGGGFCLVDEFISNMRRWGVYQNLSVHRGWFQDTVMYFSEPIALLRLDGDLYESTMVCLEHLYPQVVEGGYIIIDDYALGGCQRACKEYFGSDFKPEPVVGGKGPVWFKKEQ